MEYYKKHIEDKKLIYQKIMDVADIIHKKTRTGTGDWIMANSNAIELYLKQIEEYEQRKKIKDRIKKIEKIKNTIC